MRSPSRLDNARVLIYSHDSFGLGHLRRCRAIAHELVGRYKGISVLILSGSPVIGSFEFRARVDFVRIPGVIKLKDGSYTSLGLHIDLEQTLAIRETIIRRTAEAFNPDLFIVDKEPLGLLGEVKQTLSMLKAQGTINILGERDVIDDPDALEEEWHRKSALDAIKQLYDEVWVYGSRDFYHPLRGLEVDPEVERKIHFTGFLRRPHIEDAVPPDIRPPYYLVTPGGGKDGEEMVELVLNSCLACPDLAANVVFVLGPFMEEQKRLEIHGRVEQVESFLSIDYDPRIELLIEHAVGMITMGGYNTFCEILSFDQPAIILPRSEPRTEQLIRARRAAEMGLVKMLEPEDFTISRLAPLIAGLSTQPRPSTKLLPEMLNGMDKVCDRVVTLLNASPAAA
ncbi:MAG: glycosyltransferase family protein [bacterium]